MDCSSCREALSARLDGEDRPGEATATDAHLAGCGACREFHDRAARITRLTRTRLVTVRAPAFDAGTLPDVVPDRPRVDVLHALLAAAGVAQLALGVTGLLDAAGAGHHGGVLGGAALAHLGHESAAWNVAVGVGFLVVALRRTRPAGSLVATLGAFTAVLLATSGADASLFGRAERGAASVLNGGAAYYAARKTGEDALGPPRPLADAARGGRFQASVAQSARDSRAAPGEGRRPPAA